MENLTSMNVTKSCEFNHINNEEGNVNQESNKVDTKNESKESAEKEENEFPESKDCFKKDVDTNMTSKSLEREEDLASQQLDEVRSSSIYKKFSTLIDSDSENESIFPTTLRTGKSVCNSSEDEESESEHNISFKKISKKKSIGKTFLDSDSDDASSVNSGSDNEGRNLNLKKAENRVPNRFQTLIDSESEGEVEEYEKHLNPIKSNKKQKDENSKSKMRKVSARASKEAAMKQIQSETQRLIRETEVSLPYHRPKQRTLQEFLCRKKVASVLPKAPTMAAKLKMSSVIVDEALKKKEKEAEIFYKSSDSEEETESNSFSDKKSTNVESIQELKKDHVSRQLFVDHNFLTNNAKKSKETSSVLETEVIETDIIEPGTTEHDKTITNDLIETNINEPVILETHCEANNMGNENEITEKVLETASTMEFNSTEIDDSIQRRKAVPDKDEEVVNNSVDKSINNEIVNSNTVDETLNMSTANANDSYATMVKKSLGVTTEESDEYNEYGLPPPVFDDSPNIDQKKRLLNVISLKPKLRGTEGVMIDLTDDIKPNKKGIDALINRFVCKHATANEKIDNEPDVAVKKIKGTRKGLNIIKETVPHKLLTLDTDDPKLQIPGAKLVRLREELKHRIALKRYEELKQREQDMKEQEIEWNESINTEDHVSEPYSPSIESYISKENESEEDEEEDEDMYMMKEKKRSKCAFLDNEAEVSDNEMDDNDEIIEEDEDVDENGEESEKETESLVLDDEDEDGTNTCDSSDTFPKCKSFKRIVKPSEDDSRSCDTENNEETISNDKKASLRTIVSEDMFSGSINENEGASDAESDIPVSQTYVENDLELQMTQTPQTKTSSYKFISPLTQLTVLNTNLESENESAKAEHYSLTGEGSFFSIDGTQSEKPSQRMCDFKIQTSQRKLFGAEVNVTDEDLMQLCSGKFTQNSSTLNFSKEPAVTESQLLDICSGSFNTQVPDEKKSINDFVSEVSFKKGAQDREGESKKERKVLKLSIVSSDEEELMEKEIKNRSKKKVKKLNLSDDEEESGSLASDEENDVENDENDEEKYIDYDSEENEVVVPKKNIKKYAAEFLEEEAELSESDGDVSADEDENDLDKLEFEEGDDEDIDEAQIQKQLGKLQAKQLLDEDQKEVRILKELLFEDGDLYSESGRERKFKWRNIDKQGNNDQSEPAGNNDSRVDLSDGEDEWKWRKVMYEREQFVEQNAINIDAEIENNLSSSEIFKFGMKILKKRRIDETQKQDTLLDVDESKKELVKPHSIADMLNGSKLEGKSRVIHNVMQKRSFLAKGEETLARLAILAKQKDAPLPSMRTKNFVFAHIDPSTEVESTLATEAEAESHKWKRKR